uniref:Ig-like domain-containing protein n=1 Tax=Pavo cristatus TaxID=9049 RepID=A0A8C9F808_PAVCR
MNVNQRRFITVCKLLFLCSVSHKEEIPFRAIWELHRKLRGKNNKDSNQILRWVLAVNPKKMHTVSETVVRGVIGQPVTLPCSYRVAREKDISDMCWGRGPCPNSKCSNKLLHTTGNRVTFRTSQRYNLQGYISYGDVSLTIQEVKAEDAGTYCCRVEIPGWFNDIKQNIQLVGQGGSV